MSVFVDPTWLDSPAVAARVIPASFPICKRDVPCDTCELADRCADESLACTAFRKWSYNGDFLDKDVGRLLKSAGAEDDA